MLVAVHSFNNCLLSASHKLATKLIEIWFLIGLLSPNSYCLPNARLINREMSCWGKELLLYSEKQQTEKMVAECPKDPSYPS